MTTEGSATTTHLTDQGSVAREYLVLQAVTAADIQSGDVSVPGDERVFLVRARAEEARQPDDAVQQVADRIDAPDDALFAPVLSTRFKVGKAPSKVVKSRTFQPVDAW